MKSVSVEQRQTQLWLILVYIHGISLSNGNLTRLLKYRRQSPSLQYLMQQILRKICLLLYKIFVLLFRLYG